MIRPLQINVKHKKDIYIKWNDGTENRIELKKLRESCPCATCLTFRERQGKNFIPIFNERQVLVDKINPVGSYAIQISWQDGHNTGIYEFPFLKSLSTNK